MELEIKKILDVKIKNNFLEKEIEKQLKDKVKSIIRDIELEGIDFNSMALKMIEAEEVQKIIKLKTIKIVKNEFYFAVKDTVINKAENIAKKLKFEINIKE